jgi:competence protein ComGC
MQKKIEGQILVVILLVLSILSIFVLSMVTNTRKDTIEKIDNKKYEQFYSLAEKQLIETQSIIGIKTYTAKELDELKQADNSTKVFTGGCKESDITNLEKNAIECVLEGNEGKGVTYDSSTTLDKAITTVYISDSPSLYLYQLGSDSNLRINLKNENVLYTDKLKVYWTNATTDVVNWIVTIDYYKTPVAVGTSTALEMAAYNSVKVSNLVNPDSLGRVSTKPNTDKINGVEFPQYMEIDIVKILNGAGIPESTWNTNVIEMRLKPLIGTADGKVSLALIPENPTKFPTQFRRITAVINSVQSENGEKSPTPILNMEYPINLPINPLFDYVLRAGSVIQTE